MQISDEMRSKISKLDDLVNEVHEYLYEIQDNDEEDLTEEQKEVRSTTISMLMDINSQITELQESEGWLE